MARFSYRVKDSLGRTQKGIVEATSLKLAIDLLHERNFFIIDIKEVVSSPVFKFHLRGSGVSFTDLVYITRQLSTMITAGLTLVESLSILREQLTKPSLVKLIAEIEDQVKAEGKSMVSVLEKYPDVFPPLYVALVRAGEASGKLDVILARLADNLEKARNFRNKIRGALIYPSIVVSGMIIVSFIVMTVVVPRLTSLYKEFGVELPLPTKILIAMSNFLLGYWLIIIITTFLLIVGFIRFKRSEFGKRTLAAISLRLPIFGNLIRQSTLTDVTRTLSMLVDSGVPILTSLEIVKDATGNILYKEVFINAAHKVEKGFPLSEPLSESKLFPPILGQMVAIGEQTGKMGESLMKLSNYFEAEAEDMVRSLTTMMEPLIMVVLGLGVGFLVMAVLLPIYSLTSKF